MCHINEKDCEDTTYFPLSPSHSVRGRLSGLISTQSLYRKSIQTWPIRSLFSLPLTNYIFWYKQCVNLVKSFCLALNLYGKSLTFGILSYEGVPTLFRFLVSWNPCEIKDNLSLWEHFAAPTSLDPPLI